MAIGSKTKTLSISINNEFIKICEVTKNNKSFIVHKAITVPTPDRSYSDGTIRDRGLLAKTIKVALDDNRIASTDVVFSVASTKIVTKEVIIPSVKSNKIYDVIKTNVSEYFPVDIEQYIIQCSVLERFVQEGNDKIKVLVMAAPSDMISLYYDLASSLGLVIDAIDYFGNSTYQALRLQIDTAPSLVIQIENDSTIVNIFGNNVLQLQRTIPYGKSVIVRAIMEEFNTKYDPALKKLQNEKLLHSSFDGDNITESLKYLVGNINRIVDYYVSRNIGAPIEKAYVIGNATTIEGFNTLLGNEINLPLTSIESLRDVQCDKKTYVEEKTLPSYITNIGAFLDPVNFIPKDISTDRKKKENSNIYRLIVIAAFFVGAMLVVIPLITMIVAKTSRDSAQLSVNRIKDIEIIVDEYYEAKDIAKDAGLFQALTTNNNDALSKFIGTLEKDMPSDISIKSMNIADGVVTLSGAASGKSSVALFIQKLEGNDYIESVKVGNVTEAKDTNDIVTITFSLTCVFTNTSTSSTLPSVKN